MISIDAPKIFSEIKENFSNFKIDDKLAKIKKVALPAIAIGIGAIFAKEYLAAKTLVNFVISSFATIFGFQELFIANIDPAKDKESIFTTAALVTAVAAAVLCSVFMIKTVISFSLIKLASTFAYFFLMSNGISQVSDILNSAEKEGVSQITKPTSQHSSSTPTSPHSSSTKMKKAPHTPAQEEIGSTTNRGFTNLVNTCWMNAVLKSIVSNEHYIKRIKVKLEQLIKENVRNPNEEMSNKIELLEGIVLLAAEYEKPEQQFTQILTAIRNNPYLVSKFTLRIQHDAGEFFNCLEEVCELSKDPSCSLGMRKKTYFTEVESSEKIDPQENVIKLTTWPQFNEGDFDFTSGNWLQILNSSDLTQLEGEDDNHFDLRVELLNKCKELSIYERGSYEFKTAKLMIEGNPIFRSLQMVDNREEFIESLKRAILEESSSAITLKKLFENFDKERSTEFSRNGNKEKREFYHRDIDQLKMINVQLPRFYNIVDTLFKDPTPIKGILEDQTIEVIHPDTLERTSIKLEVSSIVCHTGSLKGGHYLSYVKEDGKWFCHNDGSVSQMTKDAVEIDVRDMGYIINYNVVHPSAN